MRYATQRLRVAVVNDFELIVRGVAGMLGPFPDRVRVVELDVGTNPEHRVDIALFDTYGHPRGGVDRVRSLATDPRVRAVVAYTWSLPVGQLDPVLAAGARGVVSKSTPAQTLVDMLVAIDGSGRFSDANRTGPVGSRSWQRRLALTGASFSRSHLQASRRLSPAWRRF